MPRRVLPYLIFSIAGVISLAAAPAGGQGAPAAGPAQVEGQAAAAPAQPQVDPRAAQVADRLMQALGGREAWDATRFIRFDFAGRRSHVWDKQTGRHRVEGKTQDGKSFVILQNLTTREGQAWLDGKPGEGEEAKQLLERGYGAWVNDTYWLLMPYKLRDPGVNLAYDGEETIDGQTYDKVILTFNGVGLTPGDRYWAYVNRSTALMDRWAYLLQDQPRDAAPTAWLWQGWQTYGRIKLAPTRQQVGSDKKIELGNIAVLDSVPDSVFSSPGPAVP